MGEGQPPFLIRIQDGGFKNTIIIIIIINCSETKKRLHCRLAILISYDISGVTVSQINPQSVELLNIF